jgi:hypothetical protein
LVLSQSRSAFITVEWWKYDSYVIIK